MRDRKAYWREYAQKNIEKKRAYMRAYRKRNGDRVRELSKQHAHRFYLLNYTRKERQYKWKQLGYSSYREYRKVYEKEWRARNPHRKYTNNDPDRAYKEWYRRTYLKK